MTAANENAAVDPITDMWIGEADIEDIAAQIGAPPGVGDDDACGCDPWAARHTCPEWDGLGRSR